MLDRKSCGELGFSWSNPVVSPRVLLLVRVGGIERAQHPRPRHAPATAPRARDRDRVNPCTGSLANRLWTPVTRRLADIMADVRMVFWLICLMCSLRSYRVKKWKLKGGMWGGYGYDDLNNRTCAASRGALRVISKVYNALAEMVAERDENTCWCYSSAPVAGLDNAGCRSSASNACISPCRSGPMPPSL